MKDIPPELYKKYQQIYVKRVAEKFARRLRSWQEFQKKKAEEFSAAPPSCENITPTYGDVYLAPKQLEFIFENMEKDAIDADQELYFPPRKDQGRDRQLRLFNRGMGERDLGLDREGRGSLDRSRYELADSQVTPEGDEAGLELRRGYDSEDVGREKIKG